MPARPDERLIRLIVRLRELKTSIRLEEDEIHNADGEGVQDQILRIFEESGRTSATIRAVEADRLTTKVRATAVYTTKEIIDAEKLKKALGHELWGKITTLALDQQKLQDAMARGLVDPNVVAQCSSTVSNRPYVKVTDIEPKD